MTRLHWVNILIQFCVTSRCWQLSALFMTCSSISLLVFTTRIYHIFLHIRRSVCKSTPWLWGWKNVQNSRPAHKSTPHSNAWLTCRQHTVCSVTSTDVMRHWWRVDCDGIDSWIKQATCGWYRDDLDSSLGRAGRHSAGCCLPRRGWRHGLRRRLTINTLYCPTARRPSPSASDSWHQDIWGYIRFNTKLLTKHHWLANHCLQCSLHWLPRRRLVANFQTCI